MARGMTQKMIAFEFGVSVNTIGNIAANAYRKLGVHGAAAACMRTATCTSSADPESTSDRSGAPECGAARVMCLKERNDGPSEERGLTQWPTN
jgi:regulatory LuxR family protein